MAKNPPAMPGSGISSRKGNGNPLQYSCLENSTDRGAWQATVFGVIKSPTRLNNWHFTSSFTVTAFGLLVQMSAQWKGPIAFRYYYENSFDFSDSQKELPGTSRDSQNCTGGLYRDLRGRSMERVRQGKQKWRTERKNRWMKSILERNLTGLGGEVQGWRERIQRRLNFKPHWGACGEGNGTPLQYSCRENPVDGGAW